MESRNYKQEYETLLESYCLLRNKYKELLSSKQLSDEKLNALEEDSKSFRFMLESYRDRYEKRSVELENENFRLRSRISTLISEKNSLTEENNNLKETNEKLYDENLDLKKKIGDSIKESEESLINTKLLNKSLIYENEKLKNQLECIIISLGSKDKVDKIYNDLRLSIIRTMEKSKEILVDPKISIYGKRELCTILPSIVDNYKNFIDLISSKPEDDEFYKKCLSNNLLFDEIIDGIYYSESDNLYQL